MVENRWKSSIVRTTFTPMALVLRRDPFDSADFLFRRQHDGFRSLAFIEEEGQARR